MRIKIVFLVVVFISFCINLSGQNDSLNKLILKNELKINLLTTYLQVVEFSFERKISNQNAIGLALFQGFPYNKIQRGYGISPYTRIYFGAKPVNGLFCELYTLFYEYKFNFSTNGSSRSIYNFHAGLGISLGYKYTINKKTTIELFGGLGRDIIVKKDALGNVDEQYNERFGLSIGRKF